MTKREADGIRLYRDGQGPPLVMLHGLGADRHMWDRLAIGRFQRVTFDFPGHGDAPAPLEPFDIGDLADQLADVLTRAGLDRVHMMGVSLGGMVALWFASSWPGRVDRLVLCDTTPALSEGMRDEILTLPGAGQAHAAMARADLMDLAEEIFAPTLVLCADGADLAAREGADFLARSIPHGRMAFVPNAAADAVARQPAWIARVVDDFLG